MVRHLEHDLGQLILAVFRQRADLGDGLFQ